MTKLNLCPVYHRKGVPLRRSQVSIALTRPGENYKNYSEGNFQKIIWPILLIGQIFGVMPVIGIKSRSSSGLHFKWISWRTFYSLFVVIVLASYTLVIIWNLFGKHVDFSSFGLFSGFIEIWSFLAFYLTNSCAFCMFFGLASKFPSLMRYWEIAEKKLPTFRNQRQKKVYTLRIRSIAFTILILALIENTLSVVTLVHFVVICEKEKDPIAELLQMQATYTNIFSTKMLNLISGKLINISATFIWSYVDVFVMTMSLGISMYFKLYNDEIRRAKGEHKSIDFWILRRKHYGKLRDLVAKVDDNIAHIVLLSFVNALFFNCKTLFLGLKPLPTPYRTLYYWYSLFFLLLRSFAVAFCASRINEESKEVIKMLNAVPSYSWNDETNRFFNEIQGENIALTGMKFFFVTRRLILGLAGTIVTYVLVLLQFASNKTQVSYCDDSFLLIKNESILF